VPLFAHPTRSFPEPRWAADQVRYHYQSDDQGARPHHPAYLLAPVDKVIE